MIWLKKQFPRAATWAADQDRMQDLQLQVAASGAADWTHVMMISVDDVANPENEIIYLYLPETYSQLFDGYEKTVAPTVATSLLVGGDTEYRRQFSCT